MSSKCLWVCSNPVDCWWQCWKKYLPDAQFVCYKNQHCWTQNHCSIQLYPEKDILNRLQINTHGEIFTYIFHVIVFIITNLQSQCVHQQLNGCSAWSSFLFLYEAWFHCRTWYHTQHSVPWNFHRCRRTNWSRTYSSSAITQVSSPSFEARSKWRAQPFKNKPFRAWQHMPVIIAHGRRDRKTKSSKSSSATWWDQNQLGLRR